MIGSEQERLSRLMQASFAPHQETTPRRDLWPQVYGRIHQHPRLSHVDGALLGILLAFGILAPRSILLLMYSL